MDGSRFDALTRTLAGHRTRRGVLAGLAGLVAGAAGPRNAEAACPDGQVNRRGLGCVCRATGRPPGDVGCPVACGGPNSCTACLPSSPTTCETADAAGQICGADQSVRACCINETLETYVVCCTPGVDCQGDPGGNDVVDFSRCSLTTQAPCIRD